MNPAIPFVEFPKIARYSREVVVTEKIDGKIQMTLRGDNHDAVREYKREYSKRRRDALRDAKLCINGAKHGPATHGKLCKLCRIKHNGPNSVIAEPS